VSEREAILARIQTVPSLPSVVIKLRQYLNEPDVNFDALARMIEYDPGLTANVLQLSNSAYFGWSRSIRTVKESIVRLGTNRIFQMVLCMSVAPLVRKPIKGYDLESEGLWRHSIATAICAELVANELELACRGEAFTAGLLHDMGKIVLGTFVDIDDEPIKEIMKADNLAFNEAEQMVLGIDHAEVAAALLAAWNLPEDVSEAVRWHHQPSRAAENRRELADLIHVSDVLCLEFGFGGGADGLGYRLDKSASDRLGLGVGIAEKVGAQVMLAVNELDSMFSTVREGESNGVQHPTR
jgi:putative nucleotidyltransferase with HDIG domain